MVVRILKWAGALLVLVALGAGLAYALRSNPIGPIAGRALTGQVVTQPVSDWSFTDDYNLVAVETRPAAPHSVTTACFSHEGQLYIPAMNASTKSWPHYAASDPRVRVKVGDRIYSGRAVRVTDPSLTEALTAAARAKYEIPEDDGAPREDIWVFRIDPPNVDVAAPRSD